MSLGQSRVLLVGLEGCVFREKGGREVGSSGYWKGLGFLITDPARIHCTS